MTVMRSVFYVPGNNEKLVSKAPSITADIITLDLEDSVPPAEKPKAREMTRENLKSAGSGGSIVYVRINNWETEMTKTVRQWSMRGFQASAWPSVAGRNTLSASTGNWRN